MKLDLSAFDTVGYAGLIVYGTFLLVCLWRTYAIYLNPESNIFKMRFHAILGISAFFDIIYYMSLAVANSYTSWGYSLHVIALFLNLVSFSQLMLFWSNTLEFGGSYDRVFSVVRLVIVVNAAVTAVVVFTIAILGVNGSGALQAVFAIIYSVSLVIFSGWMLTFGLKLYDKLTNLQKNIRGNRAAKLLELVRINGVLGACLFCYAIRVIVLIFVSLWELNANASSFQYSLLGWFIFSLWIPELLPDILLMYVLLRHETTRPSQLSQDSQDELEVDRHSTTSNSNNESFLASFAHLIPIQNPYNQSAEVMDNTASPIRSYESTDFAARPRQQTLSIDIPIVRVDRTRSEVEVSVDRHSPLPNDASSSISPSINSNAALFARSPPV